MFSLLDNGAIAQLKQEAGLPPTYAGLLGPAPDPRNLFKPFTPGPAPERKSLWDRATGGIRNLLGFNDLGGYESLLTPEQQQAAKPSLLGGLLTTIASLEPPSHQAQRRAAEQFETDMTADTLRKQREAEARQRAALAEQGDWLAANPRESFPGGDPAFMRAYLTSAVARGWPGANQAGQFARLFDEPTPKPVNWTSRFARVDGKDMLIKEADTPTGHVVQDMQGRDLTQSRVEPVPGQPPAPLVYTGTIGGEPAVATIDRETNRATRVTGIDPSEPKGASGFGISALRGQRAQLNALIAAADEATPVVQKHPEAFGIKRLSQTLNPYLDPSGDEARRLYGKVASIVRHETFGSALTPGELASSRSWIGQVYDPASKISGDLAQLRTWATQKRDAIDAELAQMQTQQKQPPTGRPKLKEY